MYILYTHIIDTMCACVNAMDFPGFWPLQRPISIP